MGTVHSHYQFSRRSFLVQLGLLGAAASSNSSNLFGLSEHGATLDGSSDSRRSVITNRAPLVENAFYLLSVGSIKPRGWLRKQLEVQANGLSGHLDETWADVGASSGWLGGNGESWERGPYFIDGLLPLSEALNDKALREKCQRFIEWSLTHQAPNGMFGPASNDDWWPRYVMLKALTQYYEVSNDPRVLTLMERYYAYQLKELPSRPLRDWGKFRWQDGALSVLWLYNRTGQKELLTLAGLLKSQGHDWKAQFATFSYTKPVSAEFLHLKEGMGLGDLALSTHGVNNGQAIKTGAIQYLLSGSDSDRAAPSKMIAILDQYHGLPNGMFSCDEHLAGRSPSQGSELCTVVEYMFSLEQSLAILGDPALADRLELLAFNALPGTFTADMWAHQYNQQPNQVECALHTKPWTTDGPESNLYGLAPNFGCCAANFHQGWPKFSNALFMQSSSQGAGDGLVAALYAPCDVTTELRGVRVQIEEETDYPYDGRVVLKMNPDRPTQFPLRLRIPSWSESASLKVNGRAEPSPQSGAFALVDREWKSGDVVELILEMKPFTAAGYKGSLSFRRGPLIFSLSTGEDWVKLREQKLTADWQVFPTKAWNYGICANSEGTASIHAAQTGASIGPLTGSQSPIVLRVQAKKIPEWRSLDGVADDLPQSPIASREVEENLTLIPYSMAKLRITAFPVCAEFNPRSQI